MRKVLLPATPWTAHSFQRGTEIRDANGVVVCEIPRGPHRPEMHDSVVAIMLHAGNTCQDFANALLAVAVNYKSIMDAVVAGTEGLRPTLEKFMKEVGHL
jgi:hypothetical protein